MLFGKGKGIWCTHVGIFFSLIIGLHHSINSVDAAESLRFEDGNSIQLIDAHGELLEWPRWEGPIELFSSYWTDRTLFGLQVNWDLSVHGEIRSPEPFGHFSFWPALKPSQGSSWIKASGHLAMAADGRLYEIHSTGKAFGREYDHPTTPKPIDFPPEVAGG